MALLLLVSPIALLRVPETQWFERQVAALAKERDAELGWQSLACTWTSGHCDVATLTVELDGLRVRIDALALSWNWRPLFSRRVEVTSLTVKGVHVERFAEATPSTDEPTPRSHTLDALNTPLPISIEKLTVDDVDIRWPVGERTLEVEKLRLGGSVKVGGAPSIALAVDGLEVRVREGDSVRLDTQLALAIRAALEGRQLTLTAKGDVTKSTPSWPLRGDDVVALEAKVDFVADQRRVDLELLELTALSDAITGRAKVSMPDEGLPKIEGASIDAQLHPLLPLLTLFEPSLSLEDTTLHVDTQGTVLNAKVLAKHVGALGSAVRDVALVAQVTPRDDRLDASAKLTAGTVAAGPARVTGVTLDVDTTDFDAKELHGEVNATVVAKALEVDGDAQTKIAPSTLTLKATLNEQLLLRLSGTPGHAKVTMDELVLDAEPAPLTIDATLDGAQRLTSAKAVLPLKRIVAASPSARLRVDTLTHTIVVKGDPRDSANLDVKLGLANVVGRRDDTSLTVDSIGLTGLARVKRWRPEHVEGALTHSGLRGSTAPGRLTYALDSSPGALDARIDGTLPPLTLHAAVKKTGPSAHGTLRASATSLGVLAPLMPAEIGGIALDPAALGFELDGSVEVPDTARPTELSLDADLTMPKLVVRRDARTISVDALALHVTHRHADKVDRGKARLTLQHPTVEEASIDGAVEANVTLALDRSRGVGNLALTLDAQKERTLALDLGLRREKDGRLHHDLEVDVSHLGRWAPLVGELSATPPGLVLEQLTARLVSHGDTLGLLDADFRPAAEWKATSDTTFHAELDVRNIVHHVEGEETRAPHVNMRIDAGVLHGAVTMAALLEAPTVEIDVGTQHVALTGVHQVLKLHSETDPDAGLLHLDLDGTIDELEQNLWPPWQPSAVHLNVDGSVDRLAALTIDRFLLESPSAGTKLELSKRLRAEGPGSEPGDALDVAGQRFRLNGRLTQDLSKLDGAPSAFMGQGVVSVGLRMQSADLATFRVRGKVELADAGVSLPSQRFVAEGVTGSIPFEEAFSFDATHGVRLVIAPDPSAFARARAAELQPFMSQDGSLSLRRVQWKDLELAPVVASLAIEPNRFALYKLKAERGRARIAGQLFVDFRPGEEVVSFRGTLTGLERKGAATPLDANAAFTFVPRRLEIDGRVQVVRTSREHLLDLLDVIDPHHEVGSLNSVRSAMAFGYPRQAQLDFSDGLLSMDIALGGLAGLFELGTVRGVSLGPFFNRYVAPALRSPP